MFRLCPNQDSKYLSTEVRLWFSEFLEAAGIERFQILYG